jgi:hypothetical protein
MAHTNDPNTTISTYYATPWQPRQITPEHINTTLKTAVQQMGLHKFGFTKDNVSSHSLRAGGAMAMKLNGVDTITIKKHGRWSSNTFLDYIQEQIGALTAGVATKMSRYIPFFNITHTTCFPQLWEPTDPNDTPN